MKMISKYKFLVFSIIKILLILNINIFFINCLENKKLSSDELDICGDNGYFDSHSLDVGLTPWNVAKDNNYIDISLCSIFDKNLNYKNYFIPNECKNSHICHNITDNNNNIIKSIGYKLQHVIPEFGTIRAIYIGPKCSNEMNYAIHLRFTCGNHLGHPSFPIVSIKSECMIILYWETSAACRQQKQTKSFGTNEMKCYILDNKKQIRDLTPLIRTNGHYRVMSESKEFYINVCTDIGGTNNRCSTINGTSACQISTLTNSGLIESVGTYKWSDMKFIESNEQNKYEHIELTYYHTPTISNCKPKTKIRFICSKELSKNYHSNHHNYPILISDLDCEYIIEWITDYACPVDMIGQSFDTKTCQIEEINLKLLPRTEFIYTNLLPSDNEKNKTILMNICGTPIQRCPITSSVCLIDGDRSQSIGTKSEGKYYKVDDHLNIVFKSKNAICKNKFGNLMNARTLIDFECDDQFYSNNNNDNQKINQPKFINFDSETCIYKFYWKTSVVCPLFLEKNLNCSLITNDSNNNLIQIDLSTLRLKDSYYVTEKSMMKFIFNVCDRLPSSSSSSALLNNKNLPKICQQSSACLIEMNQNLAFSIGHFTQSVEYDEKFKTFELLYTNGYDLLRNKTVNTRIIFICSTYQQQPDVINYNNEKSEYVIEFRTPNACQMKKIHGNDCKIYYPIMKKTFDLTPLKTNNFYVIRTEQYEFELNICNPIIGGSCEHNYDVAICQKELSGDKRKFNLGRYDSNNLIYWNSIINMTFVDGDPYNDENRTPRKSHISFICDEKAGNGHPEFIGETNRSYSFVWYTSLVCVDDVPKTVHCTYENNTHFIDFSPLSLTMGNHHLINEDLSIMNINFCRSLNRQKNNLLKNLCKANSAACLIQLKEEKGLNLGEPTQPPFMGYDGNIYFMLSNGDPCPNNNSINLTSSFQMKCERESGQFINIIQVDPDDRHKCTYEFIVETPIACPQKLNEIKLDDDCIYTDERTNLSANLSPLKQLFDYEIYNENMTNGKNKKFYLNICKSVSTINCGTNEAICFKDVDQKIYSYGKMNEVRIYKDENLHLRYSNGDQCEKQSVLRKTRSTDIEFVCSKKQSKPMIIYYDECLVKIYWETPTVCSLKVPSCSLFDTNGDYYSLRQLSSLSHSWRVNKNNTDNDYYLMNICKPIPINQYKLSKKFQKMNQCEKQSSICKCNKNDECIQSIGKVSDHELTIDNQTKNLLLTYEEDVLNCNKNNDNSLISTRTEILFKCTPNELGLDGPKFIKEENCVHYFIWNTSIACPHNLLKNDEYHLKLTNDMILIDSITNLKWNLTKLFNKKIIVSEKRLQDGHVEHYDYYIDFNNKNNDNGEKCSKAAICQTNNKGFYRDIGTIDQLKFITDNNIALHLNIYSKTSKCGRNQMKNATTKIFFECINDDNDDVQFLYESDDCEYYFLWRTSKICPILLNNEKSSRSNLNDDHHNINKQSFALPIVLLLIIICCLIFVIHRYYYEINIKDYFSRQWERLNFNNRHGNGSPTTSDVNFRYQQLNL